MSLSRPRGLPILPLLAVVGLGLTLRVPISSLAVVLPEVRAELQLSGVETSLLTSLPVLCFASIGLWLGPRMGRLGLHRAGVVVLLVMTFGAVVRAVTGASLVFIGGTFLVLAAIAIGNVLLPAVSKAHFPHQTALISSLFGAAIIGGSTLGALAGGWIDEQWGWRPALAAIAVATAGLLAVWLPLARHDRVVEAPARPMRARHLAGLTRAWPLVACFGFVSAQAYAQLGWYPAILIDAGLSGGQAATAFGVLTAVGVPTILTLPALNRVCGDRGTIIGFAAATAAGWIGLLVAPTDLTWLWSALIGFGAGSFAWTLAMIGKHAQTSEATVALSSFVQGTGYIVAAMGPFGVGLLRDLTGGWAAGLWLLVVTGAGIGVAGALAARPWTVEGLLGTVDGSSGEPNSNVGPARARA